MSTPETKQKRVRRSADERIAEIDAKIQAIHESVAELEAKKKAAAAVYDEKIAAAQARVQALEGKKAAILSPKARRKPRRSKKQMIQDIMKQAQKAGMKPQEIAERLGISLEG